MTVFTMAPSVPDSSSRRLRLASLAVMAATVASLQACGGGGGGTSTPPPPPPPPAPAPTVTSTTVVATLFGAPALVTIQGTNLTNGLTVTGAGCDSMTLLPGSNDTTANLQCTVSNYGGTVTVTGAGGGAPLSTQSFSVPIPTVTTSVISATRFGDPVLLTIEGSALDSGLSVTTADCLDLAKLTTAPHVSTATQAYYQCSSANKLSGALAVRTGTGTQLAAPTFALPAPKVAMAMTNGLGVNGTLLLNLNAPGAPRTVQNFLSYVNSGFYNGLIIHRNSPNFVLQGGGYGPSTNNRLPAPKATNAPIAYEAGGGRNLQWTMAMARTQVLDSATSQFFINLVDNPVLDNASNPYAVFGSVDPGSIALVQAIATAPCVADLTDLPQGDCLPTPNVVITSATQTQ